MAGLLIFVAALLAPLSVIAIWAHDEVSNTDRYVATVAPLASDPVVQEAIVQRASNEIFTRLQIPSLTKQAADALAAQGVPTRITDSLAALSTPLADSIKSFVTDKIRQFVQSPEFAAAWEEANREAHAGLVAVLSGKGSDSVSVQDNKVSIKLATVIKAAQDRLVARGFGLAAKIPPVNAEFTIIESDQLGEVPAGLPAAGEAVPLAPGDRPAAARHRGLDLAQPAQGAARLRPGDRGIHAAARTDPQRGASALPGRPALHRAVARSGRCGVRRPGELHPAQPAGDPRGGPRGRHRCLAGGADRCPGDRPPRPRRAAPRGPAAPSAVPG